MRTVELLERVQFYLSKPGILFLTHLHVVSCSVLTFSFRFVASKEIFLTSVFLYPSFRSSALSELEFLHPCADAYGNVCSILTLLGNLVVSTIRLEVTLASIINMFGVHSVVQHEYIFSCLLCGDAITLQTKKATVSSDDLCTPLLQFHYTLHPTPCLFVLNIMSYLAPIFTKI